jgi:hypothetical protein
MPAPITNGESGASVRTKINENFTDTAAKAPAARTITTGVGLSGGGDLTADRQFNLDIDELTAAAADGAADYVAFHDASVGVARKTLINNLGALSLEENNTSAFTIDGTKAGKLIRATHTAANVIVTFDNSTPAGSQGLIAKDTSTRLLVVAFESGATHIVPQGAANSTAFNLMGEVGLSWWCIANGTGTAAVYLLDFVSHRHAASEVVPASLVADHSGGIYRVAATGTTTIASGSQLGRGFNCQITNKPSSGFTRTITRTSGGSVDLIAGNTATISVLDDLTVMISTGTVLVL